MILKYHAVNCGKSLNEFEKYLDIESHAGGRGGRKSHRDGENLLAQSARLAIRGG